MKEIDYILEIAHRTVQFHKHRIMEELGITTNSDSVK
jgi:DNA-binding CsgD family transcriptional regulator